MQMLLEQDERGGKRNEAAKRKDQENLLKMLSYAEVLLSHVVSLKSCVHVHAASMLQHEKIEVRRAFPERCRLPAEDSARAL